MKKWLMIGNFCLFVMEKSQILEDFVSLIRGTGPFGRRGKGFYPDKPPEFGVRYF